jgi:hypothetical protein
MTGKTASPADERPLGILGAPNLSVNCGAREGSDQVRSGESSALFLTCH